MTLAPSIPAPHNPRVEQPPRRTTPASNNNAMAKSVSPIFRHNHHWYDVSLRDMLVSQVERRRVLVCWIAAALLAALLGTWWVYVRPYQLQQKAIAVLNDAGATVETKQGGPPWVALLFTGQINDVVRVDLGSLEPSDTLLDQIVGLPRLEVLIIGGREFNNRKLRRLKSLTSLKVLVLDSANISERAVAAMQWRLSETTIRKSQRLAINALRNRRIRVEIRMQGTRGQWQTAGTRHFEDAIWVLAQDTPITDADLSHVRHLSDLNWLSLARTSITDAGLVHVRDLKMLQEIDLEDTAVTDAGLEHLARLPRLRQLWLLNTKVTAKGVQRLKKLRPELRISI